MVRIGFGLFGLAAFCVAHAAQAKPDSPGSNQATSPTSAQEKHGQSNRASVGANMSRIVARISVPKKSRGVHPSA